MTPGVDLSAAPPQAAYAPSSMADLELEEMPTEGHFVRDHFAVPDVEPADWTLETNGELGVTQLTLAQLRRRARRTLRVVLECAGHRRTEFDPVPPGVPWGCGAVSEARWTGTSLGALLSQAGIPPSATLVVLEGADAGEFPGIPGTHRFARSLPLEKALHADVLLAYEINGEPIPVHRGGPVRAIVPGWYATDSVKWLTRVWFSSTPFEGPFEAHDYRLRAPGAGGPGQRMTELPVHSLITRPCRHQTVSAQTIVRGIAWGGGGIAQVDVQVDGGPWRRARLGASRGPYARVMWQLPCSLTPGPHVLSSRAVDAAGAMQPAEPVPNASGYANNSVYRVPLTVSPGARPD